MFKHLIEELSRPKTEAEKTVSKLTLYRAHLDAAKAIMEETGLMTERPTDENILNALILGFYIGKANGIANSAGCNLAIASINHEVTLLTEARLDRLAKEAWPIDGTETTLNSQKIIETVKSYIGNWWEGETEGEHTGGETPEAAAPSNLTQAQDVPAEVAVADDEEETAAAAQQSAA